MNSQHFSLAAELYHIKRGRYENVRRCNKKRRFPFQIKKKKRFYLKKVYRLADNKYVSEYTQKKSVFSGVNRMLAKWRGYYTNYLCYRIN